MRTQRAENIAGEISVRSVPVDGDAVCRQLGEARDIVPAGSDAAAADEAYRRVPPSSMPVEGDWWSALVMCDSKDRHLPKKSEGRDSTADRVPEGWRREDSDGQPGCVKCKPARWQAWI